MRLIVLVGHSSGTDYEGEMTVSQRLFSVFVSLGNGTEKRAICKVRRWVTTTTPEPGGEVGARGAAPETFMRAS